MAHMAIVIKMKRKKTKNKNKERERKTIYNNQRHYYNTI